MSRSTSTVLWCMCVCRYAIRRAVLFTLSAYPSSALLLLGGMEDGMAPSPPFRVPRPAATQGEHRSRSRAMPWLTHAPVSVPITHCMYARTDDQAWVTGVNNVASGRFAIPVAVNEASSELVVMTISEGGRLLKKSGARESYIWTGTGARACTFGGGRQQSSTFLRHYGSRSLLLVRPHHS